MSVPLSALWRKYRLFFPPPFAQKCVKTTSLQFYDGFMSLGMVTVAKICVRGHAGDSFRFVVFSIVFFKG